MSPHDAAERKFERIEQQHQGNIAALQKNLRTWEALAASSRQNSPREAASGQFREGLDAAWHFERQAEVARQGVRQLRLDFSVAQHDYDVLRGESKQAAIGPARTPGEARQTLEEKLARYNRSVNFLKASGAMSVVTAAMAADAVARHGGLTEHDRRVLDAMNEMGALIEGIMPPVPHLPPAVMPSPRETQEERRGQR